MMTTEDGKVQKSNNIDDEEMIGNWHDTLF